MSQFDQRPRLCRCNVCLHVQCVVFLAEDDIDGLHLWCCDDCDARNQATEINSFPFDYVTREEFDRRVEEAFPE